MMVIFINIQGGSKKIPHQRIGNIPATSGQILKILEAAQP